MTQRHVPSPLAARPLVRSRIAFLLACMLALSTAACGDDAAQRDAAQRTAGTSEELDRPPTPAAQVVATVNEQRIYDVDVARHAGKFKLTQRGALDELVSMELLAQEALARGLRTDPEVLETEKRESVRRFLEKQFEPTFSRPEDVPDDYVDQAWGQYTVYMYFNHEHYNTVSYVRLPVPRSAPLAEDARVKRNAEELYRRVVAAKPKDKTEFLENISANAKELGVFIELPKKDISTTRQGRTVEDFAAAAFTLKKVGDISKPARTDWGYDILFLVDIMPARSSTKAQAKAEVQKNIFETARRDVFAHWLEEQTAARNIVKNEDLLSAAAVESPLAGVQ